MTVHRPCLCVRHSSGMRLPTTTPVRLAALNPSMSGSVVDCVVIVARSGILEEVTARQTGNVVNKRSLFLSDDTGDGELTLWDNAAKNCAFAAGDAIIARNVRVHEWQGKVSLS